MNAVGQTLLNPTTSSALSAMSCFTGSNAPIDICATIHIDRSAFNPPPSESCEVPNSQFPYSQLHYSTASTAIENSAVHSWSHIQEPRIALREARAMERLLETDIKYFSYKHPFLPGYKLSHTLKCLLDHRGDMISLEIGSEVFDCGEHQAFGGRYIYCYYPIGDDTSEKEVVDESIYNAYLEWQKVMGFSWQKPSYISELEELASFLAPYGVTPYFDPEGSIGPFTSEHIQYIQAILMRLPPPFFNNDLLEEIHLCCEGGFINLYAQDSVYHDRNVYMWSGSFRGSRRNLLGMLLHELGHSAEARYTIGTHKIPLEQRVPLEIKQEMREDFDTIRCYDRGNQVYALDRGRGYEFWHDRISGSFGEFLAELPVIYFVDGPGLWNHILSIENVEQQDAYLRIYFEIQDRIFDGIEYDALGRPYDRDGRRLTIEDLHPHAT